MIYPNKEKFTNTTNQNKSSYNAIMYLFHILLTLFAIYLSFRCNGGFDILAFLIACCCPYCYIVYALGIKGCLSNY